MNPNAKLSVLGEEDLYAGAEDDFICQHDHAKCIEAEEIARQMEMDSWLRRFGVAPNTRFRELLVPPSPPPSVAYSALTDMEPPHPQATLEFLKWCNAESGSRDAEEAEWLRRCEEEEDAEWLRRRAMLLNETRKAPELVQKEPELLSDRPTTTKKGELEGKTGKEQASECVENIQSDH